MKKALIYQIRSPKALCPGQLLVFIRKSAVKVYTHTTNIKNSLDVVWDWGFINFPVGEELKYVVQHIESIYFGLKTALSTSHPIEEVIVTCTSSFGRMYSGHKSE